MGSNPDSLISAASPIPESGPQPKWLTTGAQGAVVETQSSSTAEHRILVDFTALSRAVASALVLPFVLLPFLALWVLAVLLTLRTADVFGIAVRKMLLAHSHRFPESFPLVEQT